MALGQSTVRKAHTQPTGASCQSLPQDTMQVSNTVYLSTDVALELCNQCQAEICRCPAFTPGMPCSSASSMPTNISDEQIPNLVATKPLQELNPLMHSPSDEEADQEVAAICRAPEYYQVRSHVCRRRHYFMYNTLDDIGETIQPKRPCNNSPSVQGPPVEH